MTFEQAELVASVGGSGRIRMDKFRQCGIVEDKPVNIQVPILKAAYATYDCRLIVTDFMVTTGCR